MPARRIGQRKGVPRGGRAFLSAHGHDGGGQPGRNSDSSRSGFSRGTGYGSSGTQVGDQARAGTFTHRGDPCRHSGLVLEGAGDGDNGPVRSQETEPEKRISVDECFKFSGHDDPSLGTRLYRRVWPRHRKPHKTVRVKPV